MILLNLRQLMVSVIQELNHAMKEFMKKMGIMLSPLTTDNNSHHQNDIMDRILKIATCNANGLTKHLQEIKTFIFNQNINILLVSETHFTNKRYSRIPTYCII